MPRHRKPARLYFRDDERQWVIRDGATQKRTGYSRGQRQEAENALAEYLASRRPQERVGPANPWELTVGEVLAKYADDKGGGMASVKTLIYSIQALTPFWADLTCDAVKGSTCDRYLRARAKPRKITETSKTGKTIIVERTASGPTVRRELGVLQAALNYAHKEGLLVHPIAVKLPDAGEARDRWLTLSEVAKLIRNAEPHIRRFILISIYTGRRASAVLDLIWTRVDLDAGKIRFRAEGEAETNKRRGHVSMPRQLKAHMKRWSKTRCTHVVSYRGAPVASVKTGIRRAAERAGLKDVTPHVLKHTAITWAIMRGQITVEDAAEYFDTSPETIRKHYWHHSPNHQERAKATMERK